MDVGQKSSGLRGTMTCAADPVVLSEEDDADWFAVPAFDWQSLRFLYLTLEDDGMHDIQRKATDGVRSFIASTEALLLNRSGDPALKLIDCMELGESRS